MNTDLGKYLSARCVRSFDGHMNGENAIRAYFSACSIMFISLCGNRWTINDRSDDAADALLTFAAICGDDEMFPLPSGIRYIRNRLLGLSTGSRISPVPLWPFLPAATVTSSYGNWSSSDDDDVAESARELDVLLLLLFPVRTTPLEKPRPDCSRLSDDWSRLLSADSASMSTTGIHGTFMYSLIPTPNVALSPADPPVADKSAGPVESAPSPVNESFMCCWPYSGWPLPWSVLSLISPFCANQTNARNQKLLLQYYSYSFFWKRSQFFFRFWRPQSWSTDSKYSKQVH